MSYSIEFSTHHESSFVADEIKTRQPKIFTENEIAEIHKTKDPCLVIIKPHAAANNELTAKIEKMLLETSLETLIKKQTKFTKEQVFGIYGDLCEVMAQGPEGVVFVDGLVDSFVNSPNHGIVMVVYGQDSYQKVKTIKRNIREIGAEDRFRNVLHSSDDVTSSLREINALL